MENPTAITMETIEGTAGIQMCIRDSSCGIQKLFLNTLLETYLPRQEISTTTFRVNDKADLGHRKRLIQLGFVEKERLTEFGYPTQRFVFTPPKKEEGHIHEK